MSNLWNPTDSDRKSLRSGDMKIKLHHLKQDGQIEEVECPYCGKRVFRYESRGKYLTLTGSEHRCKGMNHD